MSIIVHDHFRTEDRTFLEWYTLRNRTLFDTFSRRFSSASNKCSLSFILNHPLEEKSTLLPRILKTENFKPILLPSAPLFRMENNTETKFTRKRHARRCSVIGCNRYKISRGHCFRHGGGTPCEVAGCTSSAKIRGRCWRHGGSSACIIAGCTKRGKSRGLCWSHGGGTKCKTIECGKVAVSNGFCWAHGGGKRCRFQTCKRPAYQRTQNYCQTHYESLYTPQEQVDDVYT
uniref:Uncharacterized protein AlNc14C47G3782 n=1 Tax=Albugo laibachii Nc14 TaxID=890382 RepID=F0WAR8_9STRA|nr:conserved hypothetical protein [Albugo laibachii Nc14]|eukprot:CCA18240.1 conserved hypothetical protein [Albugo laibachii Nc14]